MLPGPADGDGNGEGPTDVTRDHGWGEERGVDAETAGWLVVRCVEAVRKVVRIGQRPVNKGVSFALRGRDSKRSITRPTKQITTVR